MTSTAACMMSDDKCMTSESGEVQTGSVKVVVNDTYETESTQHFHYVVSHVTLVFLQFMGDTCVPIVHG